ncbi:MAG: BrnA antitoxin family protein [Elusimicrobia bacterium]|nr:BrnA antitoxin family protein [Elusimicrobiota bacterium]
MQKSYGFSKMKGQKNPYAAMLKQPITIRLDCGTVAYFKSLAGNLGMPYQSLINLYLRDCAVHHKRIALKWVGAQQGPEPTA